MPGFKTFTGTAAVLDRDNVDTDQIIPKQFLKRVERSGFGKFLFFDWRFNRDGSPNPDFELNRPEAEGAEILLAGDNFGCGSSREHAPWALKDYGFKVIIAPDYADIFYNNSLKNGILVIKLPAETIHSLKSRVAAGDQSLTVSLDKQEILSGEEVLASFSFDPYWKEMLQNGWDEISITLKYEDAISRYEKQQEAVKQPQL
ncbi:3-isopropylmalate/(R)-2-methylmalate dehydratase small subunit [Fictibacillus solisalsi]|uniref:3-isopropylmalate dehydratase small subunit n=1 Tax=Fictibacillus solisalsi TaxID=459525 RepID=A0A1G9WUR8_9BACL|nr:3-isopropylmalate dehydratase small subunit [Fictibacillus solisalsi]SDM87853.1 3-isopropylmalate/(R)-2-methylmalate dehydratase small subunit [Fictibacillus solisalsi]